MSDPLISHIDADYLRSLYNLQVLPILSYRFFMESDKFYSSFFFFFFLLYFMFIGIYGIKIVNCDVLLIHSSSITMYKKTNEKLLIVIY